MPTLTEILDKAIEEGLEHVPMEERWKEERPFEGAKLVYDGNDPRKTVADILKKNDGGK